MPLRGRRLRGVVRPLVSAGLVPIVWMTALLLFALAAGWPDRAIAFRLWLVGVGLVGLNVLVVLIGRRPIGPRVDAFDAAARRDAEREAAPPPSFTETARLLELVAGTAGDVHFRVRPVLREVTAHRLLTRQGLVLDDAAQAAVIADRCGPRLWDLVRQDRPEPPDRRRHELDRDAAAEVVDRIEAL